MYLHAHTKSYTYTNVHTQMYIHKCMCTYHNTDLQPARYAVESATCTRLWHTSSLVYDIYSFMTYILVDLRHFLVYDIHPRWSTIFPCLWHTSSMVFDISLSMTCILVGLRHFLVDDTHILVGLRHMVVYDIHLRWSTTFPRLCHICSFVYNISLSMTYILVGLRHFLVYDIHPRWSTTFRRLWHTSSFGYDICSFMTYILVCLRHILVYDTYILVGLRHFLVYDTYARPYIIWDGYNE